MAIFDDEPPRKPARYEIGCELNDFSVDDLTALIAALEAEIARLETERAAKKKSRDAAGSVFR